MILEAPEMSTIVFRCDMPNCGVLFECRRGNESDRKRWIDEGWRAKKNRHICGDCAIRYMSLRDVQRELKNPKPASTVWRRQVLWKKLDQFVASGALR